MPCREVLQQRHDDRHQREHRRRDDQDEERPLASKLQTSQRIRREGRDEQRNDRHTDGDDGGVAQGAQEVVPGGEDGSVVLQRGVSRPPRVLEDFLVGPQRGHQHPVERRQAVDDDEGDPDAREDLSGAAAFLPGHACVATRVREDCVRISCRSAHAETPFPSARRPAALRSRRVVGLPPLTKLDALTL